VQGVHWGRSRPERVADPSSKIDDPVPAQPLTRARDLQPVLAGCVENLLATYDGEQGVFPYSSRVAGGAILNDYRRPEALRYTVNTLLGLGRAAKAGVPGVSAADVNEMIETFVHRFAAKLESRADLGLLIVLLAENPAAAGDEAVHSALAALRHSVADRPADAFHMQDLAWIIWGAATAARSGMPRADELGRSATTLVKEHFVDPRSSLPRHSPRWYRRGLVSFGSVAYFLRAMHEAADVFADADAAVLFRDGVQRLISIQGPLGEWPWMIHVGRGKVVDPYPVFSVHQDSMAMLFLLPALDAGEPNVREAIDRSLAWVFGRNQLDVRFYRDHPFFAYRSIERAEGAPRLRRYLRFLSASLTGHEAAFGGARIRLNDECRSYHLGWILFVWSERIAAAKGVGEEAVS
jgi:hypothetical protein